MAGLRLMVCAGLMMGITACGTRQVQVPGPDGELTLASTTLAQAAALWPGAEIRPFAACTTPAGDGGGTAPTAPAALTGDLNGDGVADTVLRIEAAGRAHLVAALARYDAAAEVIDMTGDKDLPAGSPSIERSGTRYVRQDSGLDFYFGADTVVLTACDGARTAFRWTGSGFEGIPLAATK